MTSLTCQPRSEVGEAWDELAETSPEAWVHHLNAWIDAYLTWPGVEERSFAVLDHDGRIAAAVPCYALSRKVGPIRASALNLHGGPAFRAELPARVRAQVGETIIAHLDSLGRTDRVTTIQAQLPPLATVVQNADRALSNPLWSLGFSDHSGATWMTNLAGRDECSLWESLDGRARTAIRKSMNAGVIVVEQSDASALPVYIRLHQATAERESLPGMPTGFFESIWNVLAPRGIARIYLAIRDGIAVAGVIVFTWKGGASYNSGAMNAEGRRVEANSLLLWHATKSAAAAGDSYFDYGEAAPLDADGKARSLSDFKRSFGGELYPLWRGRRPGPGRWLPRMAAVRSALAVRPAT